MTPDVGLDVGGRVIILHDLQADLEAGGVAVPGGLSIAGPSQPPGPPTPLTLYPPYPQGSRLYTYDEQGQAADLPPEAEPIVSAYVPNVP